MREISLSDLIYVKKGALTEAQCDGLIEHQNERSSNAFTESCPHAMTGVETTSTYQGLVLLPETEHFDVIHRTTDQLITEWIRYLEGFNAFHMHAFSNLLLYSHKLRLLRYDVGGWIHPHIDWDNFTHASCTFALNDGYEGGEFRFFNGNHVVKLEKGDGMIFPADPFWVHEVTEVTHGTRYSANSFITSIDEENRRDINNWYHDSERTLSPLRYQVGKELRRPNE